MAEEPATSKPGEAALKNMQFLKQESSVFKVPNVPQKKSEKKRAVVLDEDVYVEGIAKIIQRDFFPDLEKLKAQNEFLEATENKDYMRLRELTRKYSGQRPATEPYNSPATFDTPDAHPRSPAPAREPSSQPTMERPKDVTDNHTLDSFLAGHTSEDNASYDRVIALEQKKKAAKLAPAIAAEAESRALADAALELPSIDRQADQTERPLELDTWRYTARNHIMYVPAGAASQRPPRKATLRRHNTRLRAEPFDHARNKAHITALAREQDASVTGKIGVDGVSLSSEKEEQGYSLVPEPSPRPGAGPDASPLMTWGHIEGTPFRLDGSDTPLPAVGAGAAYRMLETGARERIALQLAEQAARRRRPTTPARRPTTPKYVPTTLQTAAYRMLETGARERIALQLAEQAARRRRPTTPARRPTTPKYVPTTLQTAAYRMLETGARERIALQLAEQAARRRRPTTPARRPTTPKYVPTTLQTAAYRMLETGARERIALQLAEQAARRRRPTTPARRPTTPKYVPTTLQTAAYRMLETGARERIALQLAEQAARRRRPTTPARRPTTPNFRSNTERLASMSPAARILATKHLLSPRLKLTPSGVGILAHAPSPKRTPTRRPVLAPAKPVNATADLTANLTDLTDNLLQINVEKRSRLTAQDFFKQQ